MTRASALFLRLVETADVVVENFRPGVMDRLGVGYEVLKAIRPDLVYCAISGFGQDGPWVKRPAYDQIIQGASGVMSITGDADSAPLARGLPHRRHRGRHDRGLRHRRRPERENLGARIWTSRCWRRCWRPWAGRCPTT
jgi:hypothetical protein